MKAQRKQMKCWETLPMPRGWKTMGNDDEKGNDDEVLVKETWKEWMSSHPLEGG